MAKFVACVGQRLHACALSIVLRKPATPKHNRRGRGTVQQDARFMAGPRPQLAELSRALDTLPQEKVRYLCVELGVPPATLSNIDASHPGDALTITEYLEALLAYDESLSWERIVEVLNSSRLRQHALAATIRRTYCASYAAGHSGLTVPPSPHRSRSSNTGESTASRSAGTMYTY